MSTILMKDKRKINFPRRFIFCSIQIIMSQDDVMTKFKTGQNEDLQFKLFPDYK